MRRTPYTARGIKRAKCFKCGARGFAEWRLCCDGYYRVLCFDHDAELNRIASHWAFGPEKGEALYQTYVAKVEYRSGGRVTLSNPEKRS